MSGRIEAAKGIGFDVKRPIVLPAYNRITYLIIDHYHIKFHHHNHESVLNEIRKKYVISNLRASIKEVRKNCQHCKIETTVPVPPQMAELLPARLATGYPVFSYTGVDLFGPMMVVIGRSTVKRWEVLFTCLTVRAIHIELNKILSTDSCILCVRNFISRRGQPLELRSDNGTNFCGANTKLSKALESIDI